MFTKLMLSAALLTVAAICEAAVPGEVIAVYQGRINAWAVMSPDGGNFAYISCGGNLSQGGSPRFFLNQVSGSNPLPPAYYNGWLVPPNNTELVATDEDCVQPVRLTNEGNKRFSLGRWSPNGYMIAVHAEEYDLATGTQTGFGIYLADVVYSGNRPTSVTNIRLAVPTSNESEFDWSPDSGQLVYTNAASGGTDLFVHTLATGAFVNITNTAGRSEGLPTWSSTGRIAYNRVSETSRSGDRVDIFSIPATGGAEVRITSKSTTGSPVNMGPSYSPDGQYLAFSSGTLIGDRALYRIKASGTAKAIKIVGGRDQDWAYKGWRR